ncbi:nucleotide exchange factor GrpE [bacterium]|nr:nucleotide exchange factor GrpE [bacterium]|tara:strand:- start:3342 stop:3923 length:582 start_codon:yes stop_codon:yes gene_type:complete
MSQNQEVHLKGWQDVEENPLNIGVVVEPLMQEINDLRMSLNKIKDEITRFEAFEGAKGVSHLSEKVHEFKSFLNSWKGELEEIEKKKVKRDSVKPMLVVVDALQRAEDYLKKTEKNKEVLSGIEDVTKLFEKQLAKLGFSSITPEPGDLFDPNKHIALGTADGPKGKIIQVYQSGWEYEGKVIRASEVSIGKN